MKRAVALVALLAISVGPAFAVDNVYTTSKKLTIGQFAANCDSIGGDFENHGTVGGTCSKDDGYNVTCVREGGTTTCAGNDPNRPKAPQ